MAVLGQIEGLAGDLLKRTGASSEVTGWKDSQWVRRHFITAPVVDSTGRESTQAPLSETDYNNRRFNRAYFKFTDSSLGGNLYINCPPQFTRYADVREPGLSRGGRKAQLTQATAIDGARPHLGMGRYYSDAIDDPSHIVHFQFGVTSFNSLTQFFTGFYSNSASGLARTGRLEKSFVEKFLSFAADLVSVAIMPLAIIPITFMMIGSAFRFLMRIPSSKFCYLKPTMPAYWHAVSSMVNQISVNMGLACWTPPKVFESIIGQPMVMNTGDMSAISSVYPEFQKNGVLDIYAVANKAKRMEMRYRHRLNAKLSGAPSDQWYGKVREVIDEGGGLDQPTPNEQARFSLEALWGKWKEKGILSEWKDSTVERDFRRNKDVAKEDVPTATKLLTSEYQPEEKQTGALEYFLANAADGSEFVSFRVDWPGSASESFSNSSAPNELASQLNSTSASARSKRMSFADGNLTDMPDIVKAIYGGVKDVIGGIADNLQISGFAAFGGNAFVDIPENWASHQAQLPSKQYTMTLISPYGNPVSRLMHLWVPLCMLLAGALPLATGKQSYTSPFMCAVYDRGRSITRYGMIESLNITRGTSHLGFNQDGQCLALEVSVTVKDLSTIMAMPIQQGSSVMPLEGISDAENSFSDYLMSIAGLSLREVYDRFPILMRQLNNKVAAFDTYFSASRLAKDLGGMTPAVIAGIFTVGTSRK